MHTGFFFFQILPFSPIYTSRRKSRADRDSVSLKDRDIERSIHHLLEN
jgi:hypothetical protein